MTDNNTYYENKIDLKNLLEIILGHKKLVLFFTFLGILFSIIFSLFTPNIYKSESLLAPANSNDSLSSKAREFSALAGIAGVSIPTDTASKSSEAIERLKSFDFFVDEFLPNINLENLTAVNGWNAEKNELIYDEKIFDSKRNTWTSSSTKPTSQEAFEFYKEILVINENKQTLFVSISIEHYSPYLAEKWLKIIIENINRSMRNADKISAQNSVNFLNDLSNRTKLTEIKEVIATLLAQQIQKLMLTEANQDYVFKVISSPYAPEEKSKPSRALILISGSILGLMMGLFFAFFMNSLKPIKD